MSVNLYQSNNQWANRPADERFWGLDDLASHLETVRAQSREVPYALEKLSVVGTDGGDLMLQGERKAVGLTHWSFGQLCRFANASPEYMRKLPTDLAVQCLNWGLNEAKQTTTVEPVFDDFSGDYIVPESTGKQLNLLFTDGVVRAINGGGNRGYSRLWNLDMVRSLRPATEHGWMVPPARPCVSDPRARPATIDDIVPGQEDFGLSVKVGDMIAPAGVYAGDRDMFAILINPERYVDDGVKGLMRGLMVWNSEVGAGAWYALSFLFENVCGNHIIWSASQVKKHRIVHRGKAFDNPETRIHHEVKQIMNTGFQKELETITRARGMILGKDKDAVVEALYERKRLGLTQKVIEATYTVAEQYEDTAKAPPTSVWGMVHGMTRYSQVTPYADERKRLDEAAGKLLALAAN
jgi:hypothetical protein